MTVLRSYPKLHHQEVEKSQMTGIGLDGHGVEVKDTGYDCTGVGRLPRTPTLGPVHVTARRRRRVVSRPGEREVGPTV